MLAYGILVFVIFQRLAELVLANRNTQRILANGGREYAPEHYKWIVLMHTAWLVSLVALVNPQTQMNFWFLAAFLVCQVGRVWTISTLGQNWTTRIIRSKENPIITTGPYRFVRHPNYIVVAAEIFCLPMVFGLWQISVIFSIVNALVLWVRIGHENKALGYPS